MSPVTVRLPDSVAGKLREIASANGAASEQLAAAAATFR